MRQRNIPSTFSVPDSTAGRRPRTAVDLVLRQARKLHHAAKSGSISVAMPALRRVRATGVFFDCPLSRLYRARQNLKRKHFLRALAVEAGFLDWEHFRPHLDQMPPEAIEHFEMADEWLVFLNLWFSNEEQARAFACEHGGRVVRSGTQAFVVAPDSQVHVCAGGSL